MDLRRELAEPQVLILTGPRQVGKTTLLRALERDARAAGLRRSRSPSARHHARPDPRARGPTSSWGSKMCRACQRSSIAEPFADRCAQPRLPPLPRLLRDPLLRRGPRADRALRQVVPARGAVLASEVDDLQVESVPQRRIEHRLQVALGLLDVRAVR